MTTPAEAAAELLRRRYARQTLAEFAQAIGLGGRVDNAKKLFDSLKHLIALEREAYGLGAEARKLDVTLTGKKVVELSEDALTAIAAGIHPG